MMMRFLLLLSLFIVSCSHYGTDLKGRGLASTQPEDEASESSAAPLWINHICVLKGRGGYEDYVVRFTDVHSVCPPLNDYNPAGEAYTKMRDAQQGIHTPSCRTPPFKGKKQTKMCWLGTDVLGNNVGTCDLANAQPICTACNCAGRPGITW